MDQLTSTVNLYGPFLSIDVAFRMNISCYDNEINIGTHLRPSKYFSSFRIWNIYIFNIIVNVRETLFSASAIRTKYQNTWRPLITCYECSCFAEHFSQPLGIGIGISISQRKRRRTKRRDDLN